MYTPQITGSAQKIQIFVFWGLIMTKLHDFPYLENHRSRKVGWLLKMIARLHLLMVFKEMYTLQITECLFGFLRNLYEEISKVSLSPEVHIILNWPTFQNDRKNIFLLVLNEIYTSKKWAKMGIPGLLLNANFRISSETWITITYMEIEKNQEKINVHILKTIFRNNLHLVVSLRINSILSTAREFIFANAVFISFIFFLLLLVFSLPLYFLLENGIDPAFSFIMLYLQFA